MAGKYRLFAIRLFIFLNVIVAIFFLLACLAPYLNPEKWWFISILGLGFTLIVLILCLFIFFWLLVKPRYIFISLVSLLIGYKSVAVLFAVNATKPFVTGKSKNSLRVATWNVARFIEWRRNNNAGSQTRLKMMDLIRQQNADVLCMQEFFTSKDSIYYNNIKYIKEKLGYPYYYFSWDGDGYLQWVGQVIFSRIPIIDSGVVHYPLPAMQEALIHADIVFNGDTIRVYNTHLQSVQFRKKEYTQLEKIKNRDDSLLQNSRDIFSKLKIGIINRARQANIVKEMLGYSVYPYILCGDFNDVPNSYTYFTIKDGLQDAFLKKGFGIGRTFSGISPTLRIDYILPEKQFCIQQYNRIVKKLSDHYMQVVDVQLPTGSEEK